MQRKVHFLRDRHHTHKLPNLLFKWVLKAVTTVTVALPSLSTKHPHPLYTTSYHQHNGVVYQPRHKRQVRKHQNCSEEKGLFQLSKLLKFWAHTASLRAPHTGVGFQKERETEIERVKKGKEKVVITAYLSVILADRVTSLLDFWCVTEISILLSQSLVAVSCSYKAGKQSKRPQFIFSTVRHVFLNSKKQNVLIRHRRMWWRNNSCASIRWQRVCNSLYSRLNVSKPTPRRIRQKTV